MQVYADDISPSELVRSLRRASVRALFDIRKETRNDPQQRQECSKPIDMGNACQVSDLPKRRRTKSTHPECKSKE